MIALSKGNLMTAAEASLFSGRSLVSDCGKYVLVKPKDIPMLVNSGVVSEGFVTSEVLTESGLSALLDMQFQKAMSARLCLLGREGQLVDGSKIATQFPVCTKSYISKLGITCEIIKIHGSAETMISLGVSDFIVDVVSTGATAREHGLKILDVLMPCDLYRIKRRQS